jgi:hypothetical protein
MQYDSKQVVLLLLFHQTQDLLKLFRNKVIIFFPVGNRTTAAVLHAAFKHHKISAAVFTQRIEGTVAEQAIEFLRRHTAVAGKVLTGRVGEKGKPLLLSAFLFRHPIASLFLRLYHEDSFKKSAARRLAALF